jgi:hypothetical protein
MDNQSGSPPGPKLKGADFIVFLAGGLCTGIGLYLALARIEPSPSVAILICFGAVLAAWPVISLKIAKLSLGKDGIAFELQNQVAELQARSQALQSAMDSAVGQLAAGMDAEPPKLRSEKKSRTSPDGAADPADPNKGAFGGSADANGRVLEATIVSTNADNSWCRVNLTARSTDPGRPIHGDVIFHLHPTFPKAAVRVRPRAGAAQYRFYSYGAFTVGVTIDGEPTRLELDLSQLPDAKEPWKSS